MLGAAPAALRLCTRKHNREEHIAIYNCRPSTTKSLEDCTLSGPHQRPQGGLGTKSSSFNSSHDRAIVETRGKKKAGGGAESNHLFLALARWMRRLLESKIREVELNPMEVGVFSRRYRERQESIPWHTQMLGPAPPPGPSSQRLRRRLGRLRSWCQNASSGSASWPFLCPPPVRFRV
jgi:hypothetical protein